MIRESRKLRYYFALFTVVIVWGLDPTVNSFFYRYFSASMLAVISTFASAVLFFILSIPYRREWNKNYIKIAFPISGLNAVACVLQRIGLQYTTPSSYAFLEHLSCAVVPVALYLMVRKKPNGWQIFSCLLCLLGCLILCGVGSLSFGIGDLLCAVAGVLLGISVAATGVYAKKLDLRLYMTVYMGMYFFTSVLMTFCLHVLGIERAVFAWNGSLILAAILFGLLSVGLCWLLKTAAVTHLDPALVAVMSPFSAVIAGVVSVAFGLEHLNLNLAIGAVLIVLALLISGLADVKNAQSPPWD